TKEADQKKEIEAAWEHFSETSHNLQATLPQHYQETWENDLQLLEAYKNGHHFDLPEDQDDQQHDRDAQDLQDQHDHFIENASDLLFHLLQRSTFGDTGDRAEDHQLDQVDIPENFSQKNLQSTPGQNNHHDQHLQDALYDQTPNQTTISTDHDSAADQLREAIASLSTNQPVDQIAIQGNVINQSHFGDEQTTISIDHDLATGHQAVDQLHGAIDSFIQIAPPQERRSEHFSNWYGEQLQKAIEQEEKARMTLLEALQRQEEEAATLNNLNAQIAAEELRRATETTSIEEIVTAAKAAHRGRMVDIHNKLLNNYSVPGREGRVLRKINQPIDQIQSPKQKNFIQEAFTTADPWLPITSDPSDDLLNKLHNGVTLAQQRLEVHQQEVRAAQENLTHAINMTATAEEALKSSSHKRLEISEEVQTSADSINDRIPQRLKEIKDLEKERVKKENWITQEADAIEKSSLGQAAKKLDNKARALTLLQQWEEPENISTAQTAHVIANEAIEQRNATANETNADGKTRDEKIAQAIQHVDASRTNRDRRLVNILRHQEMDGNLAAEAAAQAADQSIDAQGNTQNANIAQAIARIDETRANLDRRLVNILRHQEMDGNVAAKAAAQAINQGVDADGKTRNYRTSEALQKVDTTRVKQDHKVRAISEALDNAFITIQIAEISWAQVQALVAPKKNWAYNEVTITAVKAASEKVIENARMVNNACEVVVQSSASTVSTASINATSSKGFGIDHVKAEQAKWTEILTQAEKIMQLATIAHDYKNQLDHINGLKKQYEANKAETTLVGNTAETTKWQTAANEVQNAASYLNLAARGLGGAATAQAANPQTELKQREAALYLESTRYYQKASDYYLRSAETSLTENISKITKWRDAASGLKYAADNLHEAATQLNELAVGQLATPQDEIKEQEVTLRLEAIYSYQKNTDCWLRLAEATLAGNEDDIKKWYDIAYHNNGSGYLHRVFEHLKLAAAAQAATPQTEIKEREASLYRRSAHYNQEVSDYYLRSAEAKIAGNVADVTKWHAVVQAAIYVALNLGYAAEKLNKAAIAQAATPQTETKEREASLYLKSADYHQTSADYYLLSAEAAIAGNTEAEITKWKSAADAVNCAAYQLGSFAKELNEVLTAQAATPQTEIKQREAALRLKSVDYYQRSSDYYLRLAEVTIEGNGAEVTKWRNVAQEAGAAASFLTRAAYQLNKAAIAQAATAQTEIKQREVAVLLKSADHWQKDSDYYLRSAEATIASNAEIECIKYKKALQRVSYVNDYSNKISDLLSLASAAQAAKPQTEAKQREAIRWLEIADNYQRVCDLNFLLIEATISGNLETDSVKWSAVQSFISNGKYRLDQITSHIKEGLAAQADKSQTGAKQQEAVLHLERARVNQTIFDYSFRSVEETLQGNTSEATKWNTAAQAAQSADSYLNNAAYRLTQGRVAAQAATAQAVTPQTELKQREAALWLESFSHYQTAADNYIRSAEATVVGNVADATKWNSAGSRARNLASGLGSVATQLNEAAKAQTATPQSELQQREAALHLESARYYQTGYDYSLRSAEPTVVGNANEVTKWDAAAISASCAGYYLDQAASQLTQAATAQAAIPQTEATQQKATLHLESADRYQTASYYRLRSAEATVAGNKDEATRCNAAAYSAQSAAEIASKEANKIK
ncbi:MAG: hypothetical protein ACH346_05235, partial [Chthoniobacterales bacterium]